EAHADVGVETLHGLHETDIAYLDDVAERHAIARVAAGDVHDEAQVRHHELAGSLEVAVIAETLGEFGLVLARQHGDAAHLVHVRVEASDRTGHEEVTLAGDQSSGSGRNGGHRYETSLGDLLP